MNKFLNFFDLPLHHIGYIIPTRKVKRFENLYNKKFHFDKIQGVRVMFVKDNSKNELTEYIVKEGKSKNQNLGFNHLCFSVKNMKSLKKIELKIKYDNLGFPISRLVKSGSKECNYIKFYYFKNIGIFEFNLLKK